ncbi:hypothetical protein SASPL_114886 [Salvia splendens]|uniref:Nuclease associated modular domain-containing protein n=1 Tax=Salvia splendens TaxID=180675 RepID=A0A8X9A142_SALSN|nr:hypothetical protein SASPL_114886 [Salvia splendens]
MDRIGHGNKGRVPWNKGRKHSEETRERISRKTKEALKDPKVRKKMSEAPRVLRCRPTECRGSKDERAYACTETERSKGESNAQKRREREEIAKVGQEPTRKRNKWSQETREKLVEFEEAKLKERLMKIRRKKSTISRVSSQRQRQRMWEKFDLDLAEGKHLQKDISLADQIRVAKMRSRTAA